MGLLKELEQANIDYEKRVAVIMDSLFSKLEAMPNNPAVKELNTSGSIYLLNFSSLGNSWSPKYHNFRLQYKMIQSRLDRCQTSLGKLKALEDMIVQGFIQYKQGYHGMSAHHREPLHPKVIEYLKTFAL